MKTTIKTLAIALLLLVQPDVFAQVQATPTVEDKQESLRVKSDSNFEPSTIVFQNPVRDQLKLSKIDPREFNRAEIYNRQGSLLSSRVITGPELRMDVQQLPEGIYILLLRSTLSLKEKSIKFVVSN